MESNGIVLFSEEGKRLYLDDIFRNAVLLYFLYYWYDQTRFHDKRGLFLSYASLQSRQEFCWRAIQQHLRSEAYVSAHAMSIVSEYKNTHLYFVSEG